jgi:hypothetical protein
LDKFTKAAITKEFFPNARDRLKTNISNKKTEFYGHGNWARKNQSVPPPIQVNRQRNVSLQQGRPNSLSPNSSLHATENYPGKNPTIRELACKQTGTDNKTLKVFPHLHKIHKF